MKQCVVRSFQRIHKFISNIGTHFGCWLDKQYFSLECDGLDSASKQIVIIHHHHHQKYCHSSYDIRGWIHTKQLTCRSWCSGYFSRPTRITCTGIFRCAVSCNWTELITRGSFAGNISTERARDTFTSTDIWSVFTSWT